MKSKIFLTLLWSLVLTAFYFMSHGYAANPAGLSASGPEIQVSVVPIFPDGGNTMRDISVAMATTSVVLISSSPENAVQITTPAALSAPGQATSVGNLGIREWRERCVVNLSTSAKLRLYWDSNYNVYSDSFGVTLTSVPINSGQNIRTFSNTFCTTSQTPIYGIWGGFSAVLNVDLGSYGAGGYESYYDQKKRK